MKKHVERAVVAGAAMMLAIGAAGAVGAQAQAQSQAQLAVVNSEPMDIGQCRAPTSHAGTARVLTCGCPSAASDANASNAVWGTDIYTADSYICATARHAGVIGTGGGQVILQMLPGQASYTGSLRNGVQTRNYGRYSASYRFVTTASDYSSASTSGSGYSAVVDLPGFDMSMIRYEQRRSRGLGGLVSAVGRATGNTNASNIANAGGGIVDALANVSGGALDIGECTGLPPRYREEPGTLLSCTCPSNPSESSPIWGTGVYSGDSRICKAAIHAGAMDRTGGRVAIQTMADQPSYEASTHNGVTSLSYGPTRRLGSYRFVR